MLSGEGRFLSQGKLAYSLYLKTRGSILALLWLSRAHLDPLHVMQVLQSQAGPLAQLHVWAVTRSTRRCPVQGRSAHRARG